MIESPAGARLRFGRADGHALMLTTEGGNMVELRGDGAVLISDDSGCSVRLEGGKVMIQAGSTVQVNASTVEVTAAKVHFISGDVVMDGRLKLVTLDAKHVISETYTPGFGNIS